MKFTRILLAGAFALAAAIQPINAQMLLLGAGVKAVAAGGGTSIAYVGSAGLTASTAGQVVDAYTVGAGTHRLLVVCIAGDTSTDVVFTGDYNGDALTFGGKFFNPGGRWIYAMYLLNPASGSHNLTINGTPGLYILPVAADYTGVLQSGQPDAGPTTGNSAGSSVTVAITVANNGSWAVACGHAGGGGGGTSGTNATFRTTEAFGNTLLYDSNGPVSPGSYSMTMNAAAPGAVLLSFQPG